MVQIIVLTCICMYRQRYANCNPINPANVSRVFSESRKSRRSCSLSPPLPRSHCVPSRDFRSLLIINLTRSLSLSLATR